MEEIVNCKRCHSNLLFKTFMPVLPLDWEEDSETIDKEVKKCQECGCIHFELDGILVTEYPIEEAKNSFDTAVYTDSDYKIATEKS